MAKVTNAEVTADYILYAINSAHPNGLDKRTRKITSRIQGKLDVALETKAESVDFESSELDLIKESFQEAKFAAGLSRYVVILEDELSRTEK